MKYYLCFLLFAFIVCNVVEKKTEEIVLKKDFLHKFFEDIAVIIVNCGDDFQRTDGQINELMESLSPEELEQYTNILDSKEKCVDNLCMKILPKSIDYFDATYYCLVLCYE